jgi:hypothetical protein
VRRVRDWRADPATRPALSADQLLRWERALAQSVSARRTLFLAATAISVAFIGYHFGSFDHAFHIPFLTKEAFPDLYPADPFLDLRLTKASYFWALFVPAMRGGWLEPLLFVIHLTATYATFAGIWSVSMALFRRPLAALLAVTAFIFPHIGFAAFPVLEFMVLNRTVVLPVLLFALTWYLEGKPLRSFLVMGLMFNLHLISVQFVLGLCLFDSLMRFRWREWYAIPLRLGVFALGAAPLLIWSGSGQSLDFSLRPEWLWTVAGGTIYNIYYFWGPYPQIIVTTLSGISTLAMLAIGRRAMRGLPHARTMRHFSVAVLLVLAAQWVVSHWLPVTLIIGLQIMRVGVMALLLGYVGLAYALAEAIRTGQLRGREMVAVLLGFLFPPFPFIPLLVWGLWRWLRPGRIRQAVIGVSVVVLSSAAVLLALSFGVWFPGIHVYARTTPWHAAQLWARANTATDALFITPPQRWSLYDAEWRTYSRRSAVVSLIELAEASFSPAYLDSWVPRFDDLAPGARAQFAGDYFTNVKLTEAAYNSLSAEAVLALAEKYGADYYVVAVGHERDWPVAYANDGYVIYGLRGVAGP